jgi:hypothetical protein
MGIYGGPAVFDSTTALKNIKQNSFVLLRDKNTGLPVVNTPVWCDVTTDSSGAWFCVFIAHPRVTSPYNSARVGSTSPHPDDATMNKLADSDIQNILNYGYKETRTQWWHTSEADGSVWADGSLSTSTMWNQFENPSSWGSDYTSGGQRFKRKQSAAAAYSDWITSGATSGCSGPVGGWSNYYEQSCTISWFAGCEGAPAYYHCCACPVDRASKLVVWAR